MLGVLNSILLKALHYSLIYENDCFSLYTAYPNKLQSLFFDKCLLFCLPQCNMKLTSKCIGTLPQRE